MKEMRSRKRANPTTQCGKCGTELTAQTAYKRSDSTTWRSPCKACLKKRRRATHDECEAQRRSLVDRDVCDICGAPESVTRAGIVRKPTLDHDHRTGEWRGVLCSRCNTGLGMFRDNPKLLRAAAEYLDNPPGLTALPHRPAVVESLAGAA